MWERNNGKNGFRIQKLLDKKLEMKKAMTNIKIWLKNWQSLNLMLFYLR